MIYLFQMNTYITFDYELFLGTETGTVESCLLEPVRKFVSLSEEFGGQVKFVFFVDSLYLLKLREYSIESTELQQDYDGIVRQLRNLTDKGHDVQLHLHPQWFYSTYDYQSKRWLLDFEHYKLSDCSLDDVETMLHDSICLLEEIVGYKPTAFRAGGYSYPNEQRYIKLFEKYNILQDSSVRVGASAEGKYQTYDYTEVRSFSSYRFSDDIVKENNLGIFTEFPITVIQINPIRYFLKTLYARRKYQSELKISGDGKGVGATLPRSRQITDRILRLFKPVLMSASVDLTNVQWLDEAFKVATESKSDTFVIIGHPKNCTNYSLMCFRNFLKSHQLKYNTFHQ